MLNFNDFQTLRTFAEAYFHLGYSVIPLLGDQDPARPKVPAIAWAAYQTRRASLYDHQQWFAPAGFSGLGIVTGGISQLVVLDFDTEAAYQAFKIQYPDLLETHTVRSAGRQLPHLYFRLPAHLRLASQKGQGIDLLSDGRYVVAPPTTINGEAYRVTRGGMPKTLTERDLRRIQSFLNAHKTITAPTVQPMQSPSDPSHPISPPTADDLHVFYQHLVSTGSRNEALFRTSLFARDRHLSIQQTQNCLVSLHTHQKGTRRSHETLHEREQEALQTIRSAFSRPARTTAPQVAVPSGLVANSVRESLMQRKMTYVVRTYEALLQSGIRPGQQFTAAQAVKRLQGLVGRDSVLKALQAKEGGHFLFRIAPPVSPPHTANAIAHSHLEKQSKKCFLIVSKNQEKQKTGRPIHHYHLPGNKQLCRLLGIKISRSDALEQADLVSARQIRLALHRQLIKRRAGSYPKRWLAARLGVSRRTIFTYNQLAAIHSRPLYLETPIRWHTLDRLPLDEPLQGAYLQTPRGKKYPAQRQIAAHLLAAGEALTLKQQTVNYYWYGDAEPSPVVWSAYAQQQTQRQAAAEQFLAQTSLTLPPITAQPRPRTPEKPPSTAAIHNYKRPLANAAQEAFAIQLYDTLNQLKGTHFQKLSHASARWLAATTDETRLRSALKRLEDRSQAGMLRNPVGFFITLVRSPAHRR